MITDQIFKATEVKIIDQNLHIFIEDRCFSFHLSSLSDVFKTASSESISNFKLSPSGYGIHWPDLNEDISIHVLLHDKRHME
ncbi:MAG: DUF2442 domain-containing protein [Saprospiraceae bacterium]|nr:DUF2442 domain-containing protein [Saprospiraceae bacterium]